MVVPGARNWLVPAPGVGGLPKFHYFAAVGHLASRLIQVQVFASSTLAGSTYRQLNRAFTGVSMADSKPGDSSAADKLKRYWSHGKGAELIGWGAPGDFDRCVKALMTHAGMSKDHAEGYCYRRHVEALGITPQQHGKQRG